MSVGCVDVSNPEKLLFIFSPFIADNFTGSFIPLEKMGIVLIVMMFVAMLLLGWWEIRRSRRRFREAKEQLNSIYGEVKDQPDSEKSIKADNIMDARNTHDSGEETL